MYLWF